MMKLGEVKDTSEAVRGILEAVPVYEDALQPAAQELGKGFLTLAKTVNMALSPLSGMVWGYEKISQYLESSIANKLKGVSEERIIIPDPSVAGPAIEALRFTAHNEEIREMFSSLLATAMNSDIAEKAHPSFVEIIKQLSPDEAKLISNIPHNGLFPLVGVNSVEKKEFGGFYVLKKNFSNLPYILNCSHPEMTSSYFENLDRLGLISIDTVTRILEEDTYRPLEEHLVIQSVVASVRDPLREANIIRYSFSRTEFGEKFINACTAQ